MKIHQSVLKRERQAITRRERNRSALSMLKTLIRKVNNAVDQKKVEQAKEALHTATSALDKAASKGFIHRNTAARRVSHLTRSVQSIHGDSQKRETAEKPSKRKKN